MKLSTKGRYGLRALIYVAQYAEEEPVSISSISQGQGISERYLEQLMSKLKKAELITSIRGASGGYTLNKPASDISVGDVLRALEGSLEPVECHASEVSTPCDAADGCVTKYVWQKINESINNTVNSIYIDQLVNESKMLTSDSDLTESCK